LWFIRWETVMAGKRYWAVLIKQSLLVFAIIFVTGAIVDHLINDVSSRSPIMAGLVAIAAYLAATTIIGLLHAVSQMIYLWLFSGDDMVGSMLDDLRSSRLPPPNDRQPKTFDYIEQLANDEEAPANDRVRAAVLYGGYNAVMMRGLFRALALRKALDEAVLRYTQEAPKAR